jgi:hypothetical protein
MPACGNNSVPTETPVKTLTKTISPIVPNQSLDHLNIQLSLGGPPLAIQPVPLNVKLIAKDIEGKITIQVTLPDEMSLADGSLEWGEEPSNGTINNDKRLFLNVLESGFYWIEVNAFGKMNSGELIRTRRTLYVYQGFTRHKGNRPPYLEIASPFNLIAVISPEPVIGEAVHIETWLYTNQDLPNIEYSFSIPKSFEIINGSNIAPKSYLSRNTYLKLDVDLRPTEKGEWPMIFKAISKPGVGYNQFGMKDIIINFIVGGIEDSSINGFQR